MLGIFAVSVMWYLTCFIRAFHLFRRFGSIGFIQIVDMMDVTISVGFIYGQINNLIRYASARIINNMRPNELLVLFDAALAVVVSHFDCVAAYTRGVAADRPSFSSLV